MKNKIKNLNLIIMFLGIFIASTTQCYTQKQIDQVKAKLPENYNPFLKQYTSEERKAFYPNSITPEFVTENNKTFIKLRAGNNGINPVWAEFKLTPKDVNKPVYLISKFAHNQGYNNIIESEVGRTIMPLPKEGKKFKFDNTGSIYVHHNYRIYCLDKNVLNPKEQDFLNCQDVLNISEVKMPTNPDETLKLAPFGELNMMQW